MDVKNVPLTADECNLVDVLLDSVVAAAYLAEFPEDEATVPRRFTTCAVV
jgi:hypothetical protein